MDFYAPQFQQPDIIGSYLRGQQGALQTQNMQQQGVLNQQAIQQGQFAQQEQPLKLEQLKIAMQAQQMRQVAAQQFLDSQGGSQGGAQATPSSTGGSGIQSAQTAPQAASQAMPGAPQMQPGQSPLDSLADPARVAVMARYGQFNAILSGGDALKPVSDAQGIQAAAMKDRAERTKLALQPSVDELQSLITSPTPERLIMANPTYMEGWKRYAPKLGLDPADPRSMTPDNVRAAATLAHNDLAAQSMGTIAPQAMPAPWVRGNGAQINPVTNEAKADPSSIGPAEAQRLSMERQRLELAQKTTEGFNGKAGELLAALTENGVSLPAGMRSKEQQLATINGLLSRHPEMSADEIAVQVKEGKIAFGAETRGVNAFTSGKQGDTVRALSVATDHLGTLSKLSDALQNGDMPLVNKLGNTIAQQTGGAAPTNFDTARRIVADEVIKAVVGAGGSTADREEAARVINSANSPAQLKGAIATYQQLMGGQLSGLRRQYEQSTGRTDFERFVSEQAKSKLEGAQSGGGTVAHPEKIQSLLDKYK